ncbi:hypothetical protein JYQ62_08365 [Nostoc sp. UHCC 0702]|nr:hypothetical protein JYQ62_08365 [Nostoc sp. UHCC 0702]
MNEFIDGQTKKISGRRKKCVAVPQPKGLGDVSLQGRSDGIKQGGFSSQDSQGRDTTGTNVIVKTTSDALGKILKRLEILEKGFNDYVGSHRQRLKARLDDNESFTASFEQEMKLIRQEIYDLAAQEDEELEDEGDEELEENSEEP